MNGKKEGNSVRNKRLIYQWVLISGACTWFSCVSFSPKKNLSATPNILAPHLISILDMSLEMGEKIGWPNSKILNVVQRVGKGSRGAKSRWYRDTKITPLHAFDLYL